MCRKGVSGRVGGEEKETPILGEVQKVVHWELHRQVVPGW